METDSFNFAKELWSLANIVTGFSIAQSIGVAIALGKDLEKIQKQTVVVKGFISFLAFACGVGYSYAVWRCWDLAKLVDTKIPTNLNYSTIWREVTYGRIIGILLFTVVLIFGIYAPNIFKSKDKYIEK